MRTIDGMTIAHRSVIMLAACAVPTLAMGQYLVGHRGASYDAPENTLEAIRLAWQQGADGAEADFYLSSDGEIVCFHDKDTERVAGKKLIVKDTDYATLQSLDVGSWKDAKWRGARIPTMQQVLAEVPPGKKVVIELKMGPRIVEPMAEIIEQSDLSPAQIMIISFKSDTIARCEELLPELRSHWLTGYKQQDDGTWKPGVDEVIATLNEAGADGFGSQARPEHFDEKFIEKLRQAGHPEFHVWTVDEPEVARYYRRLGASWITTNRPGWLREQMDSAGAN